MSRYKRNRELPNWDPNQYLKFAVERTQPSIDLAKRINTDNPKTVIDIGCGPGNSTHALMERWPDAKLTGLDSSRTMIEKAKQDYPDCEWIIGDASTFQFGREYDVVFSNAALQWMPDHESLVPRLFTAVASGGALAVQVPADQGSHIRRSMIEVAARMKWSRYTSGCEKLMNYRSAEYYYDIAAPLCRRFELWETTYHHVLESQAAVVEWYKATGMKPFLERLPDDGARKEFEDEVLAGCKGDYEIRPNGKVLYPFRRIFFIAYK